MQPDKEQLRQVIANGNDNVDNILLLNRDGNFILFQGAGGGAVEHLDYVTRWETFDAGSDYVGIEASKDEKLLDDLVMKWANEAWKRYEKTGNTQIMNPYL
ncbi:hypothetical protein CPAST_c25960 [Clostridium pasteurianum DSM 525 = ATCC 6013]|uniref:Uncharacterized protein n=1 Tax=Clostridium pasteurianum DSM 525 = ATCC 6013 TaxID=1262449 RepID=A0A0H3JAL3_CLOPA|nr:hypothetical protein [Clostridium pasteurianum]AJA48665.1 hypothetical protein CPAST_c25960 [Clostridium pasteurianum DSM 525 = ATCC 6013]AJA52653.1 hypothetical protein CLPA_c25960 [Clostridium pasteurianum DSM 525 = ATCC 6013]AOZ75893.1 hypothetical protein AQ983_12620 [Clostridium pasteurianum DSM 525 = ATCC 6013]AOZ79689.1 hypothetical protein AQ984_12615 [Clostridium pasteurianum]ELP59965.1 hypothetical protein F502_04997 [Clostridium pasteurianum DSM 525 = ATCC 6013]